MNILSRFKAHWWISAIFLCFIFSLAHHENAHGQGSNENLIQLSGIITTADTTDPVPFATVRIKNEPRGTAANMEGFYTLVVKPGDTLEYSALGRERVEYVIPEDTEEENIRRIQPLDEDAILMEEQIIFPWPTKSQFKRAFLNLDMTDDYTERAEENLRREILREMNRSLAMDGPEAQAMEMRRISHDFSRAGGQLDYYMTPEGGTPVPSSLLNPMAWQEFIQSIQEDDYSIE